MRIKRFTQWKRVANPIEFMFFILITLIGFKQFYVYCIYTAIGNCTTPVVLNGGVTATEGQFDILGGNIKFVIHILAVSFFSFSFEK